MAGCFIKHKDDFIISVERLGARFEVKTAVLLEIQTFCDAGFVSWLFEIATILQDVGKLTATCV